jgi:hypothetical protein
MTTTLFLKSESKTKPASVAVRTAPSMRVPVTAENREYLRRIRQAELDAWRLAPGGTLSGNRRGAAQQESPIVSQFEAFD